jgi:hypothetical protein
MLQGVRICHLLEGLKRARVEALEESDSKTAGSGVTAHYSPFEQDRTPCRTKNLSFLLFN